MATKEDEPPQPWAPSLATSLVWELAKGPYRLVLTRHASDRLQERQLVTGDVLHVLKRGYIYEEAEQSTRAGFFKYRMESSTPNSHARTLRVIIVPSVAEKMIKIITVMWKDEGGKFGNSR